MSSALESDNKWPWKFFKASEEDFIYKVSQNLKNIILSLRDNEFNWLKEWWNFQYYSVFRLVSKIHNEWKQW